LRFFSFIIVIATDEDFRQHQQETYAAITYHAARCSA
jgi:hypothetical protein